MLLSITSTTRPATDLGFLLHKNPARAQQFDMSFGTAHVFYPVADDDIATCTLLVDVDPVGLVRDARSVPQYVTDRPYAASSMLAVAIGRVFGTALSGRSKDRPELVDAPLDLTVDIPVLPACGGEEMIRTLFEPLGWTVDCHQLELPSPPGGSSRYWQVRVSGRQTVQRTLAHLTVLIPVLDDDKHHFIGVDEVDKLLRRGDGWLSEHPEMELITRRYLRRRNLTACALEALATPEEQSEAERVEGDEVADAAEQSIEAPLSLNRQRQDVVIETLKRAGAHRVLDLGCGEGKLLALLRRDAQFTEIVGVDVSAGALKVAERRLHTDRQADERVRLLHGSVVYPDRRLAGYDAACLVEVVEHIDPDRLDALEAAVFAYARAKTVVLTTPNAEYNSVWESLPAGKFRHSDHRFEWTRAQLTDWAQAVAGRHGYEVTVAGIGPVDAEQDRGQPTQIAVFERSERTP